MIYGAIRHINKNVEYESFIDEDNSEFQAFQHGKIEFPNVRINPLDANLIASSPDMYKDLNSLIMSITSHPDYVNGSEDDEWHTLVNSVNRTIAKAEGFNP